MIEKTVLVPVLGRPNAGKSTLVNALVGQKVSIVTDKPQTTRKRLMAALNDGGIQYVFIDTPGYHLPRSRLGGAMHRAAHDSLEDSDAAILVVEPVAHAGTPERLLAERITAAGIPFILVVNKIDTVEKSSLLSVIDTYGQIAKFEAVVPLSAREGDGLDSLLDELKRFSRESEPLFPEGCATDQPDREMISELVREKLLLCLDKEIPHGAAVEVETLNERADGVMDIGVVIYCEKKSHKGIIIGKNGAMLKRIGVMARTELEEAYESKVNFSSWVRVKENWRDNPSMLRMLGMDE